MSLASQSVFLIPHSRILFSSTNVRLKSSSFSLSLLSTYFKNPPHFPISKTKSPKQNQFIPFRTHQWPIRVYESGRTVDQSGSFNHLTFDAFLSVAEFLCLASSVVISIVFAVNSVISSSQKPFLVWLGNKVFVWQFFLLAGAVVFGASIRRRQWSRMCSDLAKPGNSGVNLVGRIEKLEEDLRSSVTIIRSLSRQLEKLGIRFRVTRKALKEPIAETVALAQKNSEATRALAVQEDILEKELGEIQKVLLAMQEQQQKQLELILAIGKTGKLWETRASGEGQAATETRNAADSRFKQTGSIQLETVSGQTEINDRI